MICKQAAYFQLKCKQAAEIDNENVNKQLKLTTQCKQKAKLKCK